MMRVCEFDFVKRLFVRLNSLLMVVLMAALMSCVTSCSSDDVDSTDVGGSGVTISGNSTINIGSAGGEITISFNTSSSYTLTTDNPQMVTIKSGASGTSGQNRATLQVSENSSDGERWAEISISVSGYATTKIYTIVQSYSVSVDTRDEVMKWVDQRLKEEYYWLDIYGKAVENGAVDYTLSNDYQSKGFSNPYSEFLDRTLLSLEGNEADGSKDEDGNHTSLYSRISRTSAASSSTRSGSSVQGFGLGTYIILQVSQNPNNYAFPIDYVYPDSPAAKAGLKRGDRIYEINGAKLSDSNYADAWRTLNYGTSGSLSIGYQVVVDGESQIKTINLAAGTYSPNPIAYSKVLDLPAELNPSGKKIGYLSYLGFEADYDNDLISAMTSLAAQGVEEMVLDMRLNGGGSVDTSIKLASMMLSESEVGGVYAYLRRHKDNPYGDETCNIVKNNPATGQDLPNLNLSHLWVITTNWTASASEMVIKGLEGLDIPVKMIGLRTEGKNCGMDVMERVFGAYKYSYAPITFMNYNAKEDNDYADGIVPDTNFDDWLSKPILDENGNPQKNEQGQYMYKSNFDDLHLQRYIDRFPVPECDWAVVENDGENPFDVALYEAIMQINGTTALVPRTEQEATRAAEGSYVVRDMQKFNHKLKRQGGGSLYYGLDHRAKERAQAEAQSQEQ